MGIDPLPFLTSLNSLPEMKGGGRGGSGESERRGCGRQSRRSEGVLVCEFAVVGTLGRAGRWAVWAEMSGLGWGRWGEFGRAAGVRGESDDVSPGNLNRL